MLIFVVLANFVYFSYISDRNLIILYNLLGNYPAHKIDQLLLLGILSLLIGINSLWSLDNISIHFFVLASSINALSSNALLHSPYNSLFICRGSQLYQCLIGITQYMDHLFNLILSTCEHSHRLLCINYVEIWSSVLQIFRYFDTG